MQCQDLMWPSWDMSYCGNQGTVQDSRQRCPGLLTFGEAKLHVMAELSVFKQSRETVYVSFVLL